MKKIMILGAGPLQVPIIQRAKERGLYVIVISPDEKQPGVKYADKHLGIDVRSQKDILDKARELKIDGITTDQTDLPVRTAAYVADNMGLPSIGYDKGCLFTDKFLMREKCKEIGVYVPEYALVSDIKEAEHFFEKCNSSIIIKPVDSQGSYGVAKINTKEELRIHFDEAKTFSRDGKVIAEQWVEGTEFPVDSYVIDGKCNFLVAGQYHPFNIPNVFASYKTVWPANQPEEIIDLLTETNRKIVEGFGLLHGRTHGEYIVTPNGKCCLVEIGARGGGSYFSSDDIRIVTGFSTEDFLLDFALGISQEPEFAERESFCCCTLFFYLPANGEVVEVCGMDEVMMLPYVGRNNLDLIYKTMKTKSIEDKGARYSIVVKADTYEQLEERIDLIRSTLKIETEVNGEVLLPIWE